ncbi:MAG: hypothetical protein ACYSTI_14090, partial [Planctomycetota bacterium]
MPKDPNDLFEQFGISPTEGNLALDTDPDDLFQAFGISPEAEQPTVAPEPTPFDPEGSGYDYQTAEEAGITPDENKHWPSLDARTGMVLKGM